MKNALKKWDSKSGFLTLPKIGVALLLFVVVLSCKKYSETEEATAEMTETAASADNVSSSAAVENKNSDRKFIRTADAKFKVKNVAQSTYAIENATTKFGGFVTYTNLQSSVSEKFDTKISQDSTLETTRYKVENNITIRVPNTQLDTVIKTIAKQIDFLDYRVIKADDVSLQLLSNQLAQNRSKNYENRLEKAIDEKGRKLKEINPAEENLNNQKENNDNKKLENLALNDKVNFSTISLYIYQPETTRLEMVVNQADISAYRPHIGIQILDGLRTGWYMLEAIIGFIVQLWSLILIAFVGYFVYKKYWKQSIKVS
ncbi:DUF4349 domain-containing protein [Flavobacterium sp. PLA-1-15]|uniref:DUF4349 domain-containing protein n=1 Tax=Flavobacterium sp. PLA-1-15 TaxID=3380533 RepID=UPI003B7A6A40